jgi:hypothetical protein
MKPTKKNPAHKKNVWEEKIFIRFFFYFPSTKHRILDCDNHIQGAIACNVLLFFSFSCFLLEIFRKIFLLHNKLTSGFVTHFFFNQVKVELNQE